jgi:plastocyanin
VRSIQDSAAAICARVGKAMLALLPVVIGLQILLPGVASASDPSTLSAGQSLAAGQALWSTDGRYEAVMQGDGNFVEYGPSGVVWASNTAGTGSSDRLVMQGDGNLVIYTSSGSAVWSSSTAPSSNDKLVMQTDGNLVIYSQGELPLWASHGGRTGYSAFQLSAGQSLAAGQALWSTDGRYEAVMQGDGNFVEYGPSGVAWASHTAAAGSRIVMQGDGNLVIYSPSGVAQWSSNTAPSSGDRLVVQTDGNLVIYSGSSALWAKGQLLTGPPGPYNAGIITHANAVPSGTYGGQCLVWVANIVKAAGGPTIAFGYNPATYQSQWAKIANQVSWANVRPGDIVQFVTSSNEHTLIITGGNSPSTATVVDSNFGLTGLVSRGSFASRAAGFGNANYIIWRIHG